MSIVYVIQTKRQKINVESNCIKEERRLEKVVLWILKSTNNQTLTEGVKFNMKVPKERGISS